MPPVRMPSSVGGSAPQAFERPPAGTAITPAVLALLDRDLDRELGRALYLPSTQQLLGSARTKDKAPYKVSMCFTRQTYTVSSSLLTHANEENGDFDPCKAPDWYLS
ncbi:LOW QUALITY PROTEIN: hypothetical protein MKX08_001642 [Trichoderma sp. CBMAI-0020]|nr:LOW QUALITY PROTEIN: hypothetical protein MKX08_001642 [Trichoderma sp. CBMAI-0020]